MNNKNKILVGCLALLLVLSVGYALFSETITINGTATAKGDFDITTTCTPGYSEEFVEYHGWNSVDDYQGGFENSICNVNGNIVTMTTDLLYPTARRTFIIKMTNTGTIPAIIWGSEKWGTVESLDPVENGFSWSLKNKETDDVIKSGIDDQYEFADGGGGLVISKDGSMNADNNFIYDREKGYAGIKLNPGDSLHTPITFKFNKKAVSLMTDNGNSEYFEIKLNHEFKWEQYTDNPNYESTTFDEWCFLGC